LKTSHVLAVLLIVVWGSVVRGQDLSTDQQREIIQNFMYVTGQSEQPGASLAASQIDRRHPIKCGTPVSLEVTEFTAEKTWGADGYLSERGLIPMPVSHTSTRTPAFSEQARRVTLPPEGVYLWALLSKLLRI